MPIFDYCCTACGHAFDALQKLGADPLLDCPACLASALQKQLSAPAFHLKGKGWRKSDDTPRKPDVRPKFAHTFDSPMPHAEHSHAAEAKNKAKADTAHKHHRHEQGGHHSHDQGSHSHGHGSHHSHSHGSDSQSHGSHTHSGHAHGHSHGDHKHD